MMRGFAQERIQCTQAWISLWLAIHEPLMKTVQIYGALASIHPVVGTDVEGSVKAYPHLGRTVREVGVAVAEGGHTNGHVWTDRKIPIHRKAAVDGLLAAFVVQRLVQLHIRIFQAHTIIKASKRLADAQ